MKNCLRCTFIRWAERQQEKVKEWEKVPSIANTHLGRLHDLEREIAVLDACEDCKEKK